jgi:Putative zinc-finger
MRLGCDEVRVLAPDVALGLLTGEERAAALAHLQGCESCRAEVAALAVTADEVLLAAPEATPPAGFAAGVLARLVPAPGTESVSGDGLPPVPAPVPVRSPLARIARRRRVSLAAMAAAAVTVVVAGILAVIGSGGGDGGVVAVAEIRTGRGDVVGEASVQGDETATVAIDVPGWGRMVDAWGDDNPSGDYWLAIEQDDGTRSLRPVPTDLDGWTVRINAPAEDVTSVAMIDAQGRVWCGGRFTA